MARYARGTYSFGIDDISGFKTPYKSLKRQWNGLMVADPDWSDRPRNSRRVKQLLDAEALRNPRPDRDTGATSYPTQIDPATPGYSTWTATTQLYEVVTMTFGRLT